MFELIGKRKVERGDLVDADQHNNWWPIESVPTFAASFVAPVVQHTPVAYPMIAPGGYVPDSVCRRCGVQGRKIQRSRVTSSGWLVFWPSLFLCFPIAIVALLVMREKYDYCQHCFSQ